MQKNYALLPMQFLACRCILLLTSYRVVTPSVRNLYSFAYNKTPDAIKVDLFNLIPYKYGRVIHFDIGKCRTHSARN